MPKRIPSYRRHCSGQARVTLRGKDYLLGVYDSPESREEYARLIAEYLTSGSQGFGRKPEQLLIADVVLDYLAHAKAYYRESTEYANLKLATKPLATLYASLPASEFGPAQYKAVRAEWLSEASRSRQYVNKQMKRLLRVIKWAVSEGMMPASSYEACRCVGPLKQGRCDAREAEAVTSVSEALVNATLQFTTQVVGDMIRFQMHTACRPGEVCSLTPAMVDRSGDVWEIRLTKHKTAWRGKQRTLYAGPKAQGLLLPYLLRGSDEYCFSPAESEKQRRAALSESRTTPPSCGNRPGTNRKKSPGRKPGARFTTQSYGRSIRNACQRGKLSAWSPNQLRHLRATEIRRQFSLEAASVILGHSDLTVTQVYAEEDRQKAIEIARAVG